MFMSWSWPVLIQGTQAKVINNKVDFSRYIYWEATKVELGGQKGEPALLHVNYIKNDQLQTPTGESSTGKELQAPTGKDVTTPTKRLTTPAIRH